MLAPGGHFLLGHNDLDTIVFSSSELDLTRRLVHAFADTQEEWMDAADGTIGRKLPAIARRAPLEQVETLAWVVLDTELAAGELADTAIRGIPTPSGATSTTTSPRSSRPGSTTCACGRARRVPLQRQRLRRAAAQARVG